MRSACDRTDRSNVEPKIRAATAHVPGDMSHATGFSSAYANSLTHRRRRKGRSLAFTSCREITYSPSTPAITEYAWYRPNRPHKSCNFRPPPPRSHASAERNLVPDSFYSEEQLVSNEPRGRQLRIRKSFSKVIPVRVSPRPCLPSLSFFLRTVLSLFA